MLAWPEQHVAFWESITPILLCFCLSVAYHTCQAHQQDYKMWLLLDVSPLGHTKWPQICYVEIIHPPTRDVGCEA